MKLSFVIPAYNEEKYIGPCLESILQEIKNRPYVIEIIVVNNASTDKTKEIAQSFPGVKVVDEPRKGLTRARQRGLVEAQGELLAYVDADTRMSPDWFSIMEKTFASNENIVSVSGPYKYYDGTKIQRSVMELLWKISAPMTYFFVGYMILGGNFVIKKSALMAMGGFDTGIEFYGEDMDIARRVSQFGKSVFRMNFFIYSSIRRFADQGLFKISFLYAVNFLWQVFFHRPFKNSTNY